MTKILYENTEYQFIITYNGKELQLVDYQFKQTYLLDNVGLDKLTKKEFEELLFEYFEDSELSDYEKADMQDHLSKSDFYKGLKEEKNTNIELSIYVKNAINNFAQWSGSFTFEKAYLENDKIYLHFKEDEPLTNFELYEYFKYMREKLISCLNDNYYDCWEKVNVKRWNDYTYYILPILQVLDDIENGKKVYVKTK